MFYSYAITKIIAKFSVAVKQIEANFSIFPLPLTFVIVKGGATGVEATNLEGGGTNLEATDVELKGGSTDIELKLEPNEIDGSRKIDRKVA